jgi:acid stress-induced BolA-like protein IbaG/YrbA
MNNVMNKDTLEQKLRELPYDSLDIRVVPDGLRFTAVVTTPAFSKMDEAERQRVVWRHLRKHFSDHELVRIEFIFTDSPGDYAEESA